MRQKKLLKIVERRFKVFDMLKRQPTARARSFEKKEGLVGSTAV